MDKESIYELQKIDCNCNDCGYLFRLLDKLNIVVGEDKVLQQEIFDLTKARKIAKTKNDIANLEKNKELIKDSEDKIASKKRYLKELENSKHGYQGQRNQLQYGVCCKFKKEVSFIPNTCQIENQHCFVHRK